MASKKNDWVEWIKILLVAVVIIVFVRMFIAVPIVVEGPSMLPTLENGDRLIVEKLSVTFNQIERFDVVVFHATMKKDYIKRVIGLPGDKIEYRNDQLYVNDQPVDEPFLAEVKSQLEENTTYTTDFSLEEDIKGNKEVVPEGHVFVLGDNRTNSTDSRQLGYIPMDDIVGVAKLTYWPIDKISLLE
ncbi:MULTISPECIES: signal peptidase I [Gracilibacillus]|uniref:Signal peptidase I n=1 Tax=Gracilibacillus dipsosauri TaxID=178340 RepID=A0A317L1Y0_9BACI|nr:signal peptidase I [Gracilibacillus dipsosauri]PWU68888.1 signal peptidase I [Gracilibacillus dipsosauri]